MYQHIARITVHAASEEDYAKLHDRMASIKFVRSIVGRDGQIYALPDATYVCTSNESDERLRSMILAVINETVPRVVAPLIFVARFDSAAWILPLENALLNFLRRYFRF